jgi:hypothetical protein
VLQVLHAAIAIEHDAGGVHVVVRGPSVGTLVDVSDIGTVILYVFLAMIPSVRYSVQILKKAWVRCEC